MENEIEKKIKRLYGHLLRLNLVDYLQSSSFRVLRLEYDLDVIWSELKKAYGLDPSAPLNAYNSSVTENLLYRLLGTVYSKKHDEFCEIIGALLSDAEKWNHQNNWSAGFDQEIIDMIEKVLVSLNYGQDEIQQSISKFHPKQTTVTLFGPAEPMTVKTVTMDSIDEPKDNEKIQINDSIFIVHGHDVAMRDAVSNYVHQLGLNPIILSEEASSSKTLIEKLEKYQGVRYAIVLLSPDDIGSKCEEKENLKTRARQNVIFELGFFQGCLGRSNVCPLNKQVQELPSDYVGIVWVDFDTNGVWKLKLVRELTAAGFQIDSKKI